MTFTFSTLNGDRITRLSLSRAHGRLETFAQENGLQLHIHQGSWAGTTASVAHTGDMLLGAVASVTPERN